MHFLQDQRTRGYNDLSEVFVCSSEEGVLASAA